jgi:hypothetical protein
MSKSETNSNDKNSNFKTQLYQKATRFGYSDFEFRTVFWISNFKFRIF